MRHHRRKYDASISSVHAARYLAVDFVELVESLGQIENDLANEAYLRASDVLTSTGAEVRGDVLYYDGTYYRPTISLDWGKRLLSISIRSLASAARTRTHTHLISRFGVVQHIRITLDEKLDKFSDDLYMAVRRLYYTAYTSLENAYVAAYTKWISELFTDVYTLINTQLDVMEHSELRDRFWFSVTALGKGTFRYHFSVENVKNAIEWFKRNQSEVLGPVEAVTMLITQDVPDGFLGAPKPQSIIAYDARTRILEFAALPTLGTQTSFWLAERSLFASNSVTALQITIVDNQAFEINFPVENIQIMAEIIEAVQIDLVRIIGERYTAFRRDQRRLRSAIERLQRLPGKIGQAAKDIGLELTARVIADLLNG